MTRSSLLNTKLNGFKEGGLIDKSPFSLVDSLVDTFLNGLIKFNNAVNGLLMLLDDSGDFGDDGTLSSVLDSAVRKKWIEDVRYEFWYKLFDRKISLNFVFFFNVSKGERKVFAKDSTKLFTFLGLDGNDNGA